MSSDGVKAGRAYVELSVKDKISGGLKRAKERLAAWGEGLAAVGTGVSAFSGSILGGLGGALKHFADVGSELNDMSTATGVSAETLSALGYAAKQTGVDLGALHAGLRGMAKFTNLVASGNKGAIKTLDQLGISAGAFLAAKPEQRLALLADGLRNVSDPGIRAALAMKTLGKSGEALLPMLAEGSAGLNAFIARANELGIVITDEEAKKADALGDAWDDLLAVFGAIAFRTGAALAETMQAIIETAIIGGKAVGEFVRNNQGLIVTLAAAAAIGLAVGVVFLTLAGLSMALSMVMGGLNAVIAFGSAAWAALGAIKTAVAAVNAFLATTLTAEGLAALWAAIQTSILSAAMTVLEVVTGAAAAVLGALATPLGVIALALAAVTAALIAGAVWFFGYSEAGKSAISSLLGFFKSLWETANQTFRGIYDAIIAGRWDLAAEVAMAGLNMAWQKGVFALKSLWATFKEWLIGLFADMFAGIFQKLADFQRELVGGVNSLREQMGMAPIKGFEFIDNMASQQKSRAQGMKQLAALGREMELATAQKKVDEAQRRLDKATSEAKSARDEQAEKRKKSVTGLLDKTATPAASVTSPAATTLGTFSSAVAGLLGRSGPDDAGERTAKATESMEEHLSAIRREVEDGGLAFE